MPNIHHYRSSEDQREEFFFSTAVGSNDFSDLSEMTAIQKEDVLAALQNLNIIRYQQGSYVLSITKELFDSYQDKRRLRVDHQSLSWTPRATAKPSNSSQTR